MRAPFHAALLAAAAVLVLLRVARAVLGNGAAYQVAKIAGVVLLVICVVTAFRRMLSISERQLSRSSGRKDREDTEDGGDISDPGSVNRHE